MMGPVVQADSVSFEVGGNVLVRDASLTLFPGEFSIIVGPNGAGKSTLLKLLTREFKPSNGLVWYGSTDAARLPAWRLACQRAVMAQGARLAFPFSVYEVVRLGIDGIGRTQERNALQASVAEALAAADITHLAARAYQTLSGGEQQRVQFARVLAQLTAGHTIEQQQVLYLDEPIASLDLCHQFNLLDTARERAKAGVAVLAVLHDLNLAITYADRLIVMNNGSIVAQGAPSDVISERLLAEVFQVALPVHRLGQTPYILAQSRLSEARGRRQRAVG